LTVFATERLVVRPWSYDDVDAAYAMYSQPEMVRYLAGGPPHDSPETTRAWITRIYERFGSLPNGLGFWAVDRVDGNTAQLVGAALCVPLPGEDGRIEIGWHVGPAYQGQGYATEFARGIVDHARRHGLAVLYAVVNPENGPSLNVAGKLGMRHLGQTDAYFKQTLELFELTL
jgi:RimJ/RimL family protein N-acetyltransferase